MFGRLAQLVALLLVTGGLAAGSARADVGPPPVLQPIDYCRTAVANETYTLAQGQASVEATGYAFQATNPSCGHYILDVVVPSNSSYAAGNAFLLWGGSWWSGPTWDAGLKAFGWVTWDECNVYHGSLRVYAKSFMDSGFHWIAGGTIHGAFSWAGQAAGTSIPGWCYYLGDPGFVAPPSQLNPPPALLGYTTYRIAFKNRFDGIDSDSKVRIGAYRVVEVS
jgi:hypothetical protein